MTKPSTYIHGSTDTAEVARLIKQAKFCTPWMLSAFDAPPGTRVLDLATGIGAVAEHIQRAHPGIELHAVDLSPSQIEVARARHPGPQYAVADAAALPFPSQFFDRVHASWLLEHVSQPSRVLAEVHRVLRRGGYALFTEVDNTSLSVHPPSRTLDEAWHALNSAQRARGGDPDIGPKLEALFRRAGFAHVDGQALALKGDAANPTFFQALVDEFAEILESVEEAVPQSQKALTQAAADLRTLLRTRGSHLHYTPWQVKAWA